MLLVAVTPSQRGEPAAARATSLHFHGAGWQVHLEDLGRSLETHSPAHVGGWSEQKPAATWHARWTELTPAYQAAEGD